jgi:hypothetical protein
VSQPSPVATTIAAAEMMTGFRQLAHAGRLGSGFFKNLASILADEEAAGIGARRNGNGASHHHVGA